MKRKQNQKRILTDRELEERREFAKFRRHFTQGYQILLDRQARRCAICFEANARGKALAVDHGPDGEVRGLLCDRCNMGIGLFDHSSGRLRQAAKYLEALPTEFRVWEIPDDAPEWFKDEYGPPQEESSAS